MGRGQGEGLDRRRYEDRLENHLPGAARRARSCGQMSFNPAAAMKLLSIPAVAVFLLIANGCSSQDAATKSSAQAAPPAGAPGQSADPAATPDPDAWPRTIKRDNTTYTLYQPQLDSWDGMVLEARAAVSVQPN